MATVLTVSEINDTNLTISTLNNASNSPQVSIVYPTFDATFDSTLNVDMLITSLNGFTTNETVEVLIDSVSKGTFTLTSANPNAIWLSELTGIARTPLKNEVSKTIEFKFNVDKVLQLKLISAKEVDFPVSSVTYSNGISSAMYLLGQTEVQSIDEKSVSAISNAITNTKTEISGNDTNTITITNTYPSDFGFAFPKTYVLDNLITFKTTLPLGTEIYVKKNGNHIATYVTTSNLKSIWLSTVLGVARELVYTKSNEIYELSFVYNQFVNNKVIMGELSNFTFAKDVDNQIPNALFLMANAKTLDNVTVIANDTSFVVTYEDNGDNVKSATLDLGNGQSLNLDFVVDTSVTPNKTLVKVNANDSVFNVDIDMIFNTDGISNVIEKYRTFARRMNEINASTTV